MDEWKEIIKSNNRYKKFTLLDEPKPFDELFAGQDFPTVQLHSTQICGGYDIVGFCGACRWQGDVLTSLDHDTYTQHMTVYGYEYFYDKDNEKCLDILVGEDW